MIQRFPELQRINQGLAAPIFPVQPDQKRGDSVTVDLDPGQVPALTQEKRPTEDIRNLKDMCVHSVHLLSV
ncbi:MAG: hypothetical protein SV375_08605, partial [Thermodesulfobacteriota bacterium]|nr:hypothetical protein [Thermodesulfobacteriota bacterium]